MHIFPKKYYCILRTIWFLNVLKTQLEVASSFIPLCNHEEVDTKVSTCQWYVSIRSLRNKHSNNGYRFVGASSFSVCMLERPVGRIMGRFRSWETESMFLVMLFSIILANQDHAGSHFSIHSLDATKCPFYPMLRRDQPGRFGIYLVILLLFLEA